MKKLSLTILLLIIAITANAADYKSTFGFSFQLSKAWIVLTKTEIIKKGKSWSSDANIPFLSREQNQMTIDKMQRGEVEFYYNEKTANEVFTDNIVVDRKSGRIPYKNELKQYCDRIHDVLSNMFSKKITIYECHLVDVANKKALYIIADGPTQGTCNVYYNIQQTPNSIIGLTLNSKLSSLSLNKADFDFLIKSIRFE